MLDIFKWKCIINETCQKYFLWKYNFIKKKHKIDSIEKSAFTD